MVHARKTIASGCESQSWTTNIELVSEVTCTTFGGSQPCANMGSMHVGMHDGEGKEGQQADAIDEGLRGIARVCSSTIERGEYETPPRLRRRTRGGSEDARDEAKQRNTLRAVDMNRPHISDHKSFLEIKQGQW